ncbi:hypothetical protein B0T16DRAFT_395881 [Cercophora newfieldiana]|uniref:Uncharacterized protein n=1 Tax=Cercophora newfieldiana TaxID=92897 RepID=A0AA39YLT8_9PEZI|nr:hypothetical protein B0T16DRAFT_395881 [Cercophora newfieldiana]
MGLTVAVISSHTQTNGQQSSVLHHTVTRYQCRPGAPVRRATGRFLPASRQAHRKGIAIPASAADY